MFGLQYFTIALFALYANAEVDRNRATRITLIKKLLQLEGEEGGNNMWNEENQMDPRSDTWRPSK